MSRDVPRWRLAVLAGAALASAAATAQPADRVRPVPAVVETGARADGVLRFEPVVSFVEVEPGRGSVTELVLLNGSDVAVELDLEVLEVVAGAQGEPIPDRAARAPEWVELAERDLHLDPGERAVLRPAVRAPDDLGDGSRLAALTASDGDDSLATLLVASGGDEAAAPEARATLRRTGATSATASVRVELADDLATSVTGRMVVRAWHGRTLVDESLPEVVIVPGTPRVVELVLRPPALPGPHVLEVELRTRDGAVVSARDRSWLWNPLGTGLVVGLLVLATAVLVVRTARRLPT